MLMRMHSRVTTATAPTTAAVVVLHLRGCVCLESSRFFIDASTSLNCYPCQPVQVLVELSYDLYCIAQVVMGRYQFAPRASLNRTVWLRLAGIPATLMSNISNDGNNSGGSSIKPLTSLAHAAFATVWRLCVTNARW